MKGELQGPLLSSLASAIEESSINGRSRGWGLFRSQRQGFEHTCFRRASTGQDKRKPFQCAAATHSSSRALPYESPTPPSEIENHRQDATSTNLWFIQNLAVVSKVTVFLYPWMIFFPTGLCLFPGPTTPGCIKVRFQNFPNFGNSLIYLLSPEMEGEKLPRDLEVHRTVKKLFEPLDFQNSQLEASGWETVWKKPLQRPVVDLVSLEWGKEQEKKI